ncbi:MAG: histidine phosphatase family protein [Bifidobacteriaceae bacterium]|jgi:broad specificity phosphatase PhoE|nr:histidine phosphatase family protein [Bifidobacteriaceae bacterium]
MKNNLATFHFVRHANVYNPNNVIYEHVPGFHLSEKGYRQAEKVAEFLGNRKNWFEKFNSFTFDLSKNLYSSPLLRAQETSAPILAKLNLDMVQDARIVEARSVIPGKPIPKNIFKKIHFARNPFRPSWGEKYTDILDRMLSFMDETSQKETGKQIVCISHQTPIWVLHRYFRGKPLWHNPGKRFTPNCSITSFVYNFETKKLEAPVRYFEPV